MSVDVTTQTPFLPYTCLREHSPRHYSPRVRRQWLHPWALLRKVRIPYHRVLSSQYNPCQEYSKTSVNTTYLLKPNSFWPRFAVRLVTPAHCTTMLFHLLSLHGSILLTSPASTVTSLGVSVAEPSDMQIPHASNVSSIYFQFADIIERCLGRNDDWEIQLIQVCIECICIHQTLYYIRCCFIYFYEMKWFDCPHILLVVGHPEWPLILQYLITTTHWQGLLALYIWSRAISSLSMSCVAQQLHVLVPLITVIR